MTSTMINGTLNEVSDTRTVSFPSGDCKVLTASVRTDDGIDLPIEVWGDKKVDFVKSNVGKRAYFICSLAPVHSSFTNRQGEQTDLNYCRLKLKTMALDYSNQQGGMQTWS